MRPFHLPALPRLFCCTLAVLAAAGAAQAGEQQELFEIPSTEPIAKVYAVVMQAADNHEAESPPDSENALRAQVAVRTGEVRDGAAGHYIAVVNLKPEDYKAGSKIAVTAQTRSGEIVSLPVRSLSPADKIIAVAANCVPRESAKSDDRLLSLNEETLRTLSGLKKTKEEILTRQLEETLDASRAGRLQQLEETLGLHYAKPISKETPLEELAFRLTAIEALSER